MSIDPTSPNISIQTAQLNAWVTDLETLQIALNLERTDQVEEGLMQKASLLQQVIARLGLAIQVREQLDAAKDAIYLAEEQTTNQMGELAEGQFERIDQASRAYELERAAAEDKVKSAETALKMGKEQAAELQSAADSAKAAARARPNDPALQRAAAQAQTLADEAQAALPGLEQALAGAKRVLANLRPPRFDSGLDELSQFAETRGLTLPPPPQDPHDAASVKAWLVQTLEVIARYQQEVQAQTADNPAIRSALENSAAINQVEQQLGQMGLGAEISSPADFRASLDRVSDWFETVLATSGESRSQLRQLTQRLEELLDLNSKHLYHNQTTVNDVSRDRLLETLRQL